MSDDALNDLPQVRASTLVADVYEQLRERIFDGRLPPGADVPDSVIATQMKISRAPVREACNLLVRDGLLTKRHNHPYQVSRWEHEDLGQLNLIRWGYEAAAARQLLLTGREAIGIDQPLRDMDRALETADSALTLRADFDFHFAFVESSGLAELAQLHRRIGERILRTPVPRDLPRFILERQRARHEQILATLNASREIGDPEPVIRELSRHILTYRAVVEDGEPAWVTD